MLAAMSQASADAEEPRRKPELEPLRASFDRGDFAGLHEQLARLPEAGREADAARPLARATAVDPAHVGVLALCVIALIAITLKYLT